MRYKYLIFYTQFWYKSCSKYDFCFIYFGFVVKNYFCWRTTASQLRDICLICVYCGRRFSRKRFGQSSSFTCHPERRTNTYSDCRLITVIAIKIVLALFLYLFFFVLFSRCGSEQTDRIKCSFV